MSKVSFSRELLGVVRFVFDKTKSRTLNATQAYDKSPSQIVLASYPATASKKLLTKKVLPDAVGGVASVNLVKAGQLAAGLPVKEVLGKSDIVSKDIAVPGAIDISFAPFAPGTVREGTTKYVEAGTAMFTGVSGIALLLPAGDDADVRSKKTKEIYYGAMTVGTGDYRAWQGKYAVLKVDLLTNKAILRVYNE